MRHLTEVGEPMWLAAARKYLGVRELLDDGTLNPIVRDMFRVTRFPMDKVGKRTAWCSAGLCRAMEDVGFPHTRSAAARSWLTYGVECEPRVGSIVCFPPSNPDAGGTGHCALLERLPVGRKLRCLGFNQSNKCCIKVYDWVDGVVFRWPDLR